MRHGFLISTGYAFGIPPESKIFPCFLVSPFLDFNEEGRFKGTTDVITITNGDISYRKDLDHFSTNNKINGWFYVDEFDELPNDDVTQKAVLNLYINYYCSLTNHQRLLYESLKEKYNKPLPF